MLYWGGSGWGLGYILVCDIGMGVGGVWDTCMLVCDIGMGVGCRGRYVSCVYNIEEEGELWGGGGASGQFNTAYCFMY